MPTVTVIQPTISEEQNTKIRCAAYCRVSSDSEDQLNSFMAQMRYYSQVFDNSETEELIDIYADEGITGTREDKRDEFQRLMKDCRKGKIDRIYTKSISRFARNTRDCLKNVRELDYNYGRSGAGGIHFDFTEYAVEYSKENAKWNI